MFRIDLDKQGIIILLQAMEMYLERWPGGDPDEQEDIRQIKDALQRALLEAQFLDIE